MSFKNKFYQKYITNKQAVISQNINYYYKDLVEKIGYQYSKDSSILDLGCGSGELLSYFKNSGFKNITGVDISKEMIDNSVFGLANELIESDIFSFLANNKQKFDIIILKDILEHFPISEGVSLIQIIDSIIKPNGLIYIHVPNADGINSNLVFYGDITHEVFYSRRILESILFLADLKFKKLLILEDFPHRRSFFGFLRFISYSILTFPRRVLYFSESGNFNLICSQNISCFIYK